MMVVLIIVTILLVLTFAAAVVLTVVLAITMTLIIVTIVILILIPIAVILIILMLIIVSISFITLPIITSDEISNISRLSLPLSLSFSLSCSKLLVATWLAPLPTWRSWEPLSPRNPYHCQHLTNEQATGLLGNSGTLERSLQFGLWPWVRGLKDVLNGLTKFQLSIQVWARHVLCRLLNQRVVPFIWLEM